MRKKALLWLVPVLLTIHNLEEALFMPAYIEKRNSQVPGPLRDLVPPVTYKQFLISLVVVTLIPYLIALLLADRKAGTYLLVGFQVVMLINVFAHVMMALFLKGYAPGVVTALVINLPFSVYLLRQALAGRWLTKRALILMFPVGLLIHGPVLFGLIMLSGELAGRF